MNNPVTVRKKINQEKLITNLKDMSQKFFYQPGDSSRDRREEILKGWRGWFEDFENNLFSKQRMSDALVKFNLVKSNLNNK